MDKRQRKGRAAEAAAARYLRLRGWRILTMRHKTPVGELDIIAARGQILLFVEVKARDNEALAVEAVQSKSQARIRRAAEHFLMTHASGGSAAQTLRFDVIAVVPRSPAWLPPRCVQIKNAF